ncbi:hypothetical protein [Pseudomonas sp. N040]|uniref:hypothetical protein n=1 Tax=Pseudomonas sp. N040 TaxID=2785325 RepID=UPI0018A2DE28|nr:hypothetical protein [Pseudomonas sp. N040]MBF7730940.1 hypothetical protein [Pseudomonas sp. N040]MBW7014583.1 hypothetical protein [Pseudomonas sp. N040]
MSIHTRHIQQHLAQRSAATPGSAAIPGKAALLLGSLLICICLLGTLWVLGQDWHASANAMGRVPAQTIQPELHLTGRTLTNAP